MKLVALAVVLVCVVHAQQEDEDASYEGLKGLLVEVKPKPRGRNQQKPSTDYDQYENDKAPPNKQNFQQGGRRVSPKFSRKQKNDYDDYADNKNQAPDQVNNTKIVWK